jgi:hypothetical protein
MKITQRSSSVFFFSYFVCDVFSFIGLFFLQIYKFTLFSFPQPQSPTKKSPLTIPVKTIPEYVLVATFFPHRNWEYSAGVPWPFEHMFLK